jgi:hypothetical protein
MDTSNLKNYKLPFRKNKKGDGMFIHGNMTIKPFFSALTIGETYFVKHDKADVWHTCTDKDISDPTYEPHLGIEGNGNFAVYGVSDVDERGFTPICCPDREIFKQHKLDPENACVTRENERLGAKHNLTNNILFAPYIPIYKSPDKFTAKCPACSKTQVLPERTFQCYRLAF